MRAISEHTIQTFIGNLLRVGIVVATVVVLAGGVWHVASGGSREPFHRAFQSEPGQLTSVRGVFSGVLEGQGIGLIQMGLLILIATPIARVIFSLVAFGLQRDWVYVLITSIVLGVLAFSLSGG